MVSNSQYNYSTNLVHISTIGVGDTVIHNNEMLTVGKENIKHDAFMGTSIFGDTYKLGTKLVCKVTLIKAK